jgi:hypothetical protein
MGTDQCPDARLGADKRFGGVDDLLRVRVGERCTSREVASNRVATLLPHRSDGLDKEPLASCVYL